MSHTTLRAFLLTMALVFTSKLQAATIMVDATSDDPVGQLLVYNLKDKINASSINKLVYTKDDAGFVINIVTIKENDGNDTAYAAVLSMPQLNKKGFDYYITSQVGFCGSSVTESCASKILAAFDQPMTDIATAISEAIKKPNH